MPYDKSGIFTPKKIKTKTKVGTAIKAYVRKAIIKSEPLRVKELLSSTNDCKFSEPYIASLTNINNGDDQDDRLTNKVQLHRLKGRLHLYHDTGTASSAAYPVRVIMVQDKENTGTIPTVSDVFPNILVDNVAVIQQGLDTEAKSELKERFKILMDKVIVVSGIQSVEYNGTTKMMFWNKKMSSVVNYNGALGTDESRGQIYIMIIPGTDTSNYLHYTVSNRTYFSDK